MAQFISIYQISGFREDANNVDPNRDFSYSRKDSNCFKSSTAKLFHRIMKSNLIQIVVTFHGGMVAIGYEWGTCMQTHTDICTSSSFNDSI